MGVISTHLTEAGLKSEFLDAYKAAPAYHLELATRITSNLPQEKYRWLHALPLPKEWGTGRALHGLGTEEYNVANHEYELSIEVDRKELEDDQTGQIQTRIREMAAVAAGHPAYLLALLINSGATEGFKSYDDKLFFAADHEEGDSGAQSNSITAPCTDTAAITVAEFKRALALALQAMMGFVNDRGQSMRLAPSGIKIIPPAALYFTALEAVGATMISATDNVLKGGGEVIPLPDITGTTAFYVLKTDAPIRPFIFQDRMTVEFTSIAAGSEEEFKRGKHLYGTRARYTVAYARWQYAVKITFATE